ncbi:MAG TPA: ABC transporter substrate-binding protein [Myxococcota bacterium]|jgi:phospholipid transport system substrate-binding protein|nr:ABC transporter substrate-binding protein [Myxococcota bacterium]
MKATATRIGSGTGRALRSAAAGAGLFAAALLGLSASANGTTPDAPSTPARDTVEATSNRVLDVLNSGQTQEQKLKALEKIGDERFDLDTVSRLVLAKNWNRLDASQQTEFRTEFRQLLLATYGRRIDDYGQQKVQILGERPEPRGDATVMTKVVGGKNDFRVDYRMRPKDGEWRFIDVVVEGVSLVSSYRSQFQELMSKDGPDGLIAKIKETNARAAAGEEIPDPTARPGARTESAESL